MPWTSIAALALVTRGSGSVDIGATDPRCARNRVRGAERLGSRSGAGCAGRGARRGSRACPPRTDQRRAAARSPDRLRARSSGTLRTRWNAIPTSRTRVSTSTCRPARPRTPRPRPGTTSTSPSPTARSPRTAIARRASAPTRRRSSPTTACASPSIPRVAGPADTSGRLTGHRPRDSGVVAETGGGWLASPRRRHAHPHDPGHSRCGCRILRRQGTLEAALRSRSERRCGSLQPARSVRSGGGKGAGAEGRPAVPRRDAGSEGGGRRDRGRLARRRAHLGHRPPVRREGADDRCAGRRVQRLEGRPVLLRERTSGAGGGVLDRSVVPRPRDLPRSRRAEHPQGAAREGRRRGSQPVRRRARGVLAKPRRRGLPDARAVRASRRPIPRSSATSSRRSRMPRRSAPRRRIPRWRKPRSGTIVDLAPAWPDKAVEQARITLRTLGDERASDTLVLVRYKSVLQKEGGLLYGAVVVEDATCKNGKHEQVVHTAEVEDPGQTWPDQLREKVNESVRHGWSSSSPTAARVRARWT